MQEKRRGVQEGSGDRLARAEKLAPQGGASATGRNKERKSRRAGKN